MNRPAPEQFQCDALQEEESVGAARRQSTLPHCPTSFVPNINFSHLHSPFLKSLLNPMALCEAIYLFNNQIFASYTYELALIRTKGK